LLGMLQADVLQKLFRACPRPFGKQPLKMKRALVNMLRYRLKRGLFFEVCLYKTDRLRNPVEIELLLRFHGNNFNSKLVRPTFCRHPILAQF